SEEHTSELQSLPTKSYAVFCLKKKNTYSALRTMACCTTHPRSRCTDLISRHFPDAPYSTARPSRFFLFLMLRRPPRPTRLVTLFPYTTLFRSRTTAVLFIVCLGLNCSNGISCEKRA